MKTSLSAGRERAGSAPPQSGRRRFLVSLAQAAVGAALLGVRPGRAWSLPGMTQDAPDGVKRFVFAQLRYSGGNWDPHPSAPAMFVREIERMTSVEAEPTRRVVGLDAPELFTLPFLYVTGTSDFTPFSPAAVERLRIWVEAGGTLVADDAAGTPGYGFDKGIRRELERVLPSARLERLPAEHTVFKSFFLVRAVAGARVASPFLEGVTIQGRTAVIYSPNDLLGAFARDPLDRWLEPCAPGGERQRRLAFHLGVNIVLYALCGDYKQDRIHLPFLRQRI